MPYDGVYKLFHFSKDNASPKEYPLAVYFSLNQTAYNFHEHDSMELAIVMSGKGKHILGEKSSDIHQGDVLLIPPGIRHGYERVDDEGFDLINIMYDGSRLPIPVIDATDIPLFSYFFPSHHGDNEIFTGAPVLHIADPEVLQKIKIMAVDLKRELREKLAGNMFGAIVVFLNLILTLLRLGNVLAKTERTKVFPLGDVLKYINENFTQTIPMAVLVRKSFLSQRRFQFKFKQTTGYTVTDYINRRRIELATMLLKDRSGDISRVGAMCGYNSDNYFIRKFKAIIGCSPREYLRRQKSDTAH